MPKLYSPPAGLPARPTLRAGAMPWRGILFAAALALGPAAHAVSLQHRVYGIEASFGHDPAAVIERLRPLEPTARAAGGPDLRAFLAAWGYAHAAVDRPAIAEAAIDELTELGERSGDPAATASAYTLKAAMLAFAGQTRSALAWSEMAVPLAAPTADPDLLYWVDSTASELAAANGEIDEGIRLQESALAAAEASANPRRQAQAHLALAPLRIVRGQIAQALKEARLVRELGARSTDPALVVSGWLVESLAAEVDGQPARSLAARQSAIEQQQVLSGGAPASAPNFNSQAGGSTWLSSEADVLLQLSNLYLGTQDSVRAHAFALRAATVAREREDDDDIAHAAIDLGLADLGLGHIELGEREMADGLARMESHRRDAELLIQLNRTIAALERHGQVAAAQVRLHESLLLADELSRHDRHDVVVALQRQSSFEQRQRQLEQLQHDNAMQSAEIARRSQERVLTLLLVAALVAGVLVAWRLVLRARRSNRQLAVNNEELAYANLHDKVTSLFNRRAMELDSATIEATPGAAFCHVTLSIKQFGLIVGSVGHQLGDALLCQIAARLEGVVSRHAGRLYRVDGVIFGALFPFGTDESRLRMILQALASAMERPFEIGNQDLIVSVALGAAEFPRDATSAQEVARLAELAKQQVQADPGNGAVIYDVSIGETQRDKLRMESRMLKALEHGDFELFYQGQRGLTDGGIRGFEALLRWRDGDGMVSPAQFIPVAEESGLIVRIGAWVLRAACLQAKAWADAGVGTPKVAVNISPREFNHPEFLARVRETLRETGVDPAQIELEITEGSVMNDAEASIAQLHALRALGLRLAIDDFGTGYASLSYLRRFPLDRLKIDRSFITQLNASKQDDTIVRTVIELAHALGLSVTAEGVETPEQEAALSRWGCDVVQGFLRFRPVPAAAATALLEEAARQVPADALS